MAVELAGRFPAGRGSVPLSSSGAADEVSVEYNPGRAGGEEALISDLLNSMAVESVFPNSQIRTRRRTKSE